jgi:hypothetical protein
MATQEEKRPSAVTEVRAWLIVAMAVLIHTVAMAWWGATLTTKVDGLKETAIINSGLYKELEARARVSERDIQELRGQVNRMLEREK